MRSKNGHHVRLRLRADAPVIDLGADADEHIVQLGRNLQREHVASKLQKE
jgi:hypothetical protein